ncbi:ribosomal protein S16 domain-containing protein, partial [Mucidula mucida]
MPIRLRFALHGTRNNRIFHLVAINSRHARNAAPAELLGIYDPRLPATIHPDGTRRTPNTYNIKQNPAKTIRWSVDRIRYWLSVGAVPTKSVAHLLEAGGIL